MNMQVNMNIPGAGYDGVFRQTLVMDEASGRAECQVVNLYPEFQYEVFEGFGGAVTEAAGYVYSLMKPEQQRRLIHRYFSPDEMNYRLARVHLDSCDFCLEPYEAVSDPRDELLSGFSFARTEKYILPMLEAAREERKGDLSLMLSPWSPPAFMKTNGERQHGGRLKPEYRAMWAKILCRYIREFRERGFSVRRLSVQNEPNAAQTWDSCQFTAEEEKAFLRDHLRPEMERQGLADVELFIWDHNKERLYERVRDTVDEETAGMISGAAFHWYSGDHFEQLDLVRREYPGLKLILSESCLEYRLFDERNIGNSMMRLCHEIVGDLRHGMQAMYDWNLVLDERGGPNYAGNFAHAAYLFDTKTRELRPQKTLDCYYQLAHFILPGSRLIGSTVYSDRIDAAAYTLPDGNTLAILLNRDESAAPVTVRMQNRGAQFLLPGKTLAACLIEG